MRSSIIVILVLCCTSFSHSQVVNIESKRMQTDSIGFVFKGDLMFNYFNNNSSYIYNINTNITTQLKSKDLKKIYFLIANYNLIRSNDEDFSNSWLVHLRYNQKITNLLRIEGFVQSHDNELLTINSRNLIGVGVRLKVVSKELFKGYVGNSYMFEIEKSQTTGITNYNNRHNFYMSFMFSLFKGKVDFANTLYFQPLYDKISNHRVLEQFKMEIPINKTLSFSGLFDYSYRSETSGLTSDKYSNISFGITIDI